MAKKEAKKREPKIISLNGKDIDINSITQDDILEYCEANKQNRWLKAQAAKNIIVKDKKTGEEKEQRPTFMTIKNAFLREFFPEVGLKTAAERKKKTFLELIAELEDD